MAIYLARSSTCTKRMACFRTGTEKWGLPSSVGHFLPQRKCRHCRPRRSRRGIAADARAISGVRSGSTAPGFPHGASASRIAGEPSNLDELLASSRIVFVFADSTSENQGFLGAFALLSAARMILITRVAGRAGSPTSPRWKLRFTSGHIEQIDVFPVEPCRRTPASVAQT